MSNYNSEFKKGWGAYYPPEELIRFVNFIPKYSKLNIKKSTILDVGCGIGGCMWYLANNFKFVLGVDNSLEAISRCNKTMKLFNINKNKFGLKLIDFENFNFQNKFDFIVDNRSLYNQSFQNFINSFKYLRTKLNINGLMYTALFGKKCTALKSAEKINNNEYIIKKGRLKIGNRQVFVSHTSMKSIFPKLGFNIKNYENISIYRDNNFIERHIYCLKAN